MYGMLTSTCTCTCTCTWSQSYEACRGGAGVTGGDGVMGGGDM